MMVFRPGDPITARALTPSRIMRLGGETLSGPRYIWWNVVASAKEKIEAAEEAWRQGDWTRGRFQLPPDGDTELIPLPAEAGRTRHAERNEMDEAEIVREDGPTKGRYVVKVDGVAAEGELVYSRVNPHLLIAEHTGVPDALQGRALGRAMIERLVADARAEGAKVIPRCPYVKTERRKHPEWADVIRD
jgi:predicted GNAT family acetyltransferase